MTEYIIGGSVAILIIAIIVGISINKAVFNKYERIVKETSPLYKSLVELNRKQRFNTSISAKYDYRTYFKSKRSLDNMSLADFLMQTLAENESFFDNLFVRLQENTNLWNTYMQEYRKLRTLSFAEIEKLSIEKNLKIKSKKYSQHETRLYETLKLRMPIVETSVYCHASYTSPAGRSHYYKDHCYSHNQVFNYLKQVKLNQTEAERIAREKIERKNTLISKEERLRIKERELKAKEKQLANVEQREKELVSKEEEFIKATQDHIYSAEDEQNNIDDFDNLSPYEQLKRLKQMLDNGDIDYEEYNQKRKAIAG